MKTIPLFTALLLSLTAAAQRPDHSAACRQAMTQLAALAGDWEGKASVFTPNGPMELNQTEHIEWRLQDLLLIIEGTGRMASGDIGFQAIAVINYNPGEQKFNLHSYVKEGFSTQAYFTVLAPQQFEWGFEVPGGKSRYRITLDTGAKTWKEIGEFSSDGTNWRKFIELSLVKK